MLKRESFGPNSWLSERDKDVGEVEFKDGRLEKSWHLGVSDGDADSGAAGSLEK